MSGYRYRPVYRLQAITGMWSPWLECGGKPSYSDRRHASAALTRFKRLQERRRGAARIVRTEDYHPPIEYRLERQPLGEWEPVE